MNRYIRCKMAQAAVIFVTAAFAYSQDADTARVPIVADVDARVLILSPHDDYAFEHGLTYRLKSGEPDTLDIALPAGGSSSIHGKPPVRGGGNTAVRRHRGDVFLELPARQYANAEVSLYSVSGKRIAHGRADAQAAGGAVSISRKHVAAGVYVLSVGGTAGNVYAARLTHGGGRMDIRVTFTDKYTPLKKQTDEGTNGGSGVWKIAVAAELPGYADTLYEIDLRKGLNDPQTITLQYPKPYGTETAFVENGTFVMGCVDDRDKPRGGGKCNDDELPAHEVTITENFYIGKYEVTQKLWYDIMGTTIDELTELAKLENGSRKVEGAGDDHPVYHVTWAEAGEFIAKLNERTGGAYRLPTEAEWEFAARGGNLGADNNNIYSGGNTAGDVAWYSGNAAGSTHPVGTKNANELGLFDMSGNVYEWTADWYGGDYYAVSPLADPAGPAFGDDGGKRVYRGGSYKYDASIMRVSLRSHNNVPEEREGMVARGSIGLRLAHDALKIEPR